MDIEENTQTEGGEEQVQDSQLSKKWDYKPGAVLLILVGLTGLAFIIWLIYSVWSLSSETPAPPPVVPETPEPAKELTNEEMAPGNYSDVSGRNPEVLGLGINEDKGRYYTHPESGKTLYVNTAEECNESCQEHFEPYDAEGTLYYLYKYDNRPGDFFAENFDGVFEIARP